MSLINPRCCYDDDPKDSIKVLLDHGADAKALTNNNSTPLHILNEYCSSGALEAIPELIDAGCPVDDKNENGYTPLLKAAVFQEDPLPIIKLLLEHGADFHATTANGHGIWHKLAYTRASDAIKVFESFPEPFQPNQKDNDGTTPMHLVCCQTNDVTRLQWMLDHGGDPGLVWKNVKPIDGDYNGPRDCLTDSILESHSNIMEFLLEHRLCNPRLAIPALEWKKAKTTDEDEIKVLDELMTKIVTAAEEWGPKSEQEAAAADAATSSTGADVKTEMINEDIPTTEMANMSVEVTTTEMTTKVEGADGQPVIEVADAKVDVVTIST